MISPDSSPNTMVGVWSVVVAYRCERGPLHALCSQLADEGCSVVVVDNTEQPDISSADLPSGTRLVSLGANTGIAHAQNIGIATALSTGAEVIVFFDQDSTFEAGFLHTLVVPLRRGQADVVSPRCVDVDTRAEMPTQRLAPFGRVRNVFCAGTSTPCPTDIVISSGTAATKQAIALAGELDEDFFIDFVDTEWCLRCRSKRIPIRVVPNAVMFHRIGSHSIAEAGLTIIVHSPVRCYYQVRNSLHLFRRRHVPWLFAAREMISVLLNRLLLMRHVTRRADYLKAYAQGFRDGLLGVVGARPID